jgi:hypothetical protein
MSLIIPVEPHVDESLAGFVVRATARNHLRSPHSALMEAGIKTTRLGSLCSQPPSLARPIAAWAGTQNVEMLARMFHRPIDGRRGWLDFFGEPLRAICRQPGKRRIAPATLKKRGYAKAIWTLHPLSFDPSTKERLIDACPQCGRGIRPLFELKSGGWKVYLRAEVETELKRRVEALPPGPAPPPRPRGPRHGPDSPLGKLAAKQELSDASRIGYVTAAAVLGCTVFAVQKLAANGHLKPRGVTTPFHRVEVDALAKSIVFVPEIMRLSGYVSYVGVMNWLKLAGIAPLFWLKIGGVPVFDRTVVEKHVARVEFVRGAHPCWIRRKLLDMVARGNSVHQASIACGVSYATAKKWVATEMTPNPVRSARGEYPLSTRRRLLDMVERGNSVRQAAISCGVSRETAQRWAKAEFAA